MVLDHCCIFHIKLLLTESVKRPLLFWTSGFRQKSPVNSSLSMHPSETSVAWNPLFRFSFKFGTMILRQN